MTRDEARHSMFDAVVVGAGPNGLGAAITLLERGLSVLLVEANEQVGGACRSAALTRPGYVHDLGSAIHPLGLASPLFRRLPLERYGLSWVQPEIPFAQPLDGGRAVAAYRSLEATAQALGRDGARYRRLMAPLVANWEALLDEVLQPVLHVPRHPLLLARFGGPALLPARAYERVFEGAEGPALLAGLAAHSMLPLEAWGSSAIAFVLGMLAHAVGWPMPRGGAQALSDALLAHFQSLGGEVVTGWRVRSLDELPRARAVVLDLTPRQVVRIAAAQLPAAYVRRLQQYRYGMAAFKVDYALREPVPWTNTACRRAGTLHLGGTMAELAAAERMVAQGRHPERPYVLLAQHSCFDATRAPEGRHTLWAYCHVPLGSAVDQTDAIERQIERFAPGFREVILERRVSAPADLERMNANLVEGDINGGAADLPQLLARPVLHPVPYRTPTKGLYLCSASTPPGGGVHGMGGWNAARAVLRDWPTLRD